MAPKKKEMSKEEKAEFYKKKREKERAKQKAEQKAAKAEHNKAADEQREAEMQKIKEQLKSKGLVMTEVETDGHCMYRALAHQCKLLGRGTGNSYQELRLQTAEYMRRNADAFLPFLTGPDGDVITEEGFMEHLDGVEKNAWGDNTELQALSEVLKSRVVVICADSPEHTFGDQYGEVGHTLMLSYHKHLHTLGEHYNSVHPKDTRM
uniref:OTU domain-containing protein n=1 Tax=Eutreptiella gymnastica TaxID=73025 RepID=A0A7S4GLI9_9EUGL